MKVIIDRFEGDFAVCEKENREMIDIPKASISGEPQEGDVLEVNNEKIIIDYEATKKRRNEIAEKTKGLWK